MTDRDADVAALLDKQAITELLTRYLRSVDRHDVPAAEHWMQGLLAPDLSVLRMSAKFPADPVYAPRWPPARTPAR